MIQKKICMLGAFAVGKTSLVRRFVQGHFSEKYHTTVGVTIEKKRVTVGAREANLIVWDLYGEDESQSVRMSYLRGTAAYLLVADGTRAATLERAQRIQNTVEQHLGPVPFVLVLNKADLSSEWDIDESALAALAARGWRAIKGSAKTGEGVDEAFLTLATTLLEADGA